MVGILVSFWDGLFAGAMLVSERVVVILFLAILSIIEGLTKNPTEKKSRINLTQRSCGRTGVIILPTQTMHYYKRNPTKLPYMCIKFDPLKMGPI